MPDMIKKRKKVGLALSAGGPPAMAFQMAVIEGLILSRSFMQKSSAARFWQSTQKANISGQYYIFF